MKKKSYEYVGDTKANAIKICKVIKTVLSNTKFNRVLDVGARNGAVSKVLKELNPKADFLLIDPNANALKEAKGFKTKAIYFEDFESEENFDLILMASVLEHVEKPEEFLKKANKLLASNGNLVIFVPCLNCLFRKQIAWLYRQLRYGGKGRKEIEKEHLQLFSCNEIISMLKNNNFTPAYIGCNIIQRKIKETPNIFEKMQINAVIIRATKK